MEQIEQTVSFGYWLRRRRKQLDMTQEQLAQRAGCAVATIRKIEADERRPSRDLAAHLAECLQLAPDQRAAFLRSARAELAPDSLPALGAPGASSADPAPPQLHSYHLRERIGQGSFSVVYRAEQPEVGREVAIKIVDPAYANQPAFIRSFLFEAQIIARLEHPGIVPLYDYWRGPGGAYLVMRFMPGGSLRAALGATGWPLERVTSVLEQVGAALAFAHRRGVVHSDLKPANILLDGEGNAYLADFSIARDLLAPARAGAGAEHLPLSSPAYRAPELLAGEPATPQIDIYSLGMLLFELLTGAPPLLPLPSLAARRPDLPPALDALLARATAAQPANRYADVATLLSDWRLATAPSAALAVGALSTLPQQPAPAPALELIENPYKGLRAFGEADAADFFGRAALVARLLDRLAEAGDSRSEIGAGRSSASAPLASSHTAAPTSRFLAVVGPSGSGKSSAVRAGLVPAIRRGGLPGSEQWFVVQLQPGAHPLEELEAALLRVAVNPPSSLLEQLQADERGLARAVKRVLPPGGAELLLVIDQFEELWTLTADPAVRAHVLASITAAIADPHSRLRVVVTLRADFYDRPLRDPAFGELIRRRTEVVLPLTPQELEQAIVEPAARVGVAPTVDLLATIMQEVGDQPSALPLLQYALTELFEQRDGALMTLAAYRASGGVLGALAGRAEAIYQGLSADEQMAARQVFLRMVTLGEGAEDTRRRVLRGELTALSIADRELKLADSGTFDMPFSIHNARFPDMRLALETIIDAYGRARLLSFDRDPITHGPTVELAHESLLRVWERLRGWLEASRAEVRLQHILAAEAAQWQAAGFDPSYLLSGARLAQFAGWQSQATLALSGPEHDFLAASVARQQQIELDERARQSHELALAQQLAAAEQQRAEEHQRAASRLRARATQLAAALVLALAAVVAVVVLARNNASLADQNAASAATAQAGLVESERLRLAAEANAALERGVSADLPALLALRSLRYGYSPQADAALLQSLSRGIVRQRFAGHSAALTSVAFAPDGRTALTGSVDGTARLWEVATGRQLQILSGHDGPVNSVAFTPDGRFALSAGNDGTARVWDLASGKQLRSLAGHTDIVNAVAAAPDGRAVLTGSFDGTARVWDLASGKQLLVLRGHTGAVTSVAYAPDGQTVLTGGFDRTARLWDALSGEELRILRGHTGGLTGVAFAPSGRTALTGAADRTARLWDLASGRELRTLLGHADALAGPPGFAPDGRTVLTGSFDRTARLWDVSSGRELRRFTGHADAVAGVAFAPDGRSVLTGGADRLALLWGAQANPEPQVLASAASTVLGIALAPDGSRALLVGPGAPAELWSLPVAERLRVLPTASADALGAAFSPDGKLALISVGSAIEVWDLIGGARLHSLVADAPVSRPAFSPDGNRVFAGNARGAIAIWDVATGARLQTLLGHGDAVTQVACSPDGRTLLSSSADGTAHVWDLASGAELRALRAHAGALTSVAVSPDGTLALTGSADWTARLWDLASGRELIVLRGHIDAVTSVAFAPDGRSALTGSADASARLWDVSSGRELRRLTGHTASVASVAFAPDGRSVLTGGADSTGRLWRSDEQDVIRLACAMLPHDLTNEERATYHIADDAPTCASFSGGASFSGS